MDIDGKWEQLVELSDGTEVTLALVTPDDAPLIRRGFDALSDDSKYRRFLATKQALSDWELEYLSDVDQVNHVAIGATIPGDEAGGAPAQSADSDDQRRGIGIARFIRMTPSDEETETTADAANAPPASTAEAAITVIDEYQNRGLGMHLLEWLVRAALERGVDTFQCTLLARNEPVKKMLKLGSNMRVVERDGAVVTLAVDIGGHRDLTQQAAGGVLRTVGRGDATLAGDENET